MKKFVALYGAILLLSFHFYFFYFINSNFLHQYFSSFLIGLLYAVGGVLNLLAFIHISKILKRIGNFWLFVLMTFAEGLTLMGIAFLTDPVQIALCFIASTALNPLLFFCLDIFLESISKNEVTGGIRGLYLTAASIPPLICPFIAGLILTKAEFWKIYLIAAIFLLPLLLIITVFRNFKNPSYRNTTLMPALRVLVNNKNIYDVFIDNVLLNIFYAWMVIYMPLYLYETIGMSLEEIGALFSIMIIPFLLFQLPLGRLADKKYGEKEMLIIGFVIIGISTALIPVLSSKSFVQWAILLFITRIGASIAEIGIETYFFKKVSQRDTNLISLFRSVRALPYIFVPAIVGLILLFTDISYSFMILGLLMLLGIRYAFNLKDTR